MRAYSKLFFTLLTKLGGLLKMTKRDEPLEKLDNIMTNAFNSVADLAIEKKCYTRDAAYLIVIQRVAKAVEGRG